MKSELKPLVKSVSIPLELTAVASATDAGIQKKSFGPGMITVIITNEEMNHMMKIVKLLAESGLLIKCAQKTIKSEARKGRFLSILYGTLRAKKFINR